MTLFARELGDGDRIIVLLHGFGATHAVWEPVQSLLARRARTLAYDLPGHGRSADFPGAGPAKATARAVLADIEARGLGPVHLAGHSMGGAVAALAALLQPTAVASLTLLAPGGFGPEMNTRLLRRYARAADEEVIRTCLEAMYGFLSPVPDDAIAAEVKDRSVPGRTGKLGEIVEAIAGDGSQGTIPRRAVDGFAMPVAVVWGELDAVLPVRHSRGLPERFAVHLLPDLGHMLPREAPGLVAEVVARTAGLAPA